jgi:hypothetical protein
MRGEVVLVDTSIFMNTLDVPGWNQHRTEILKEIEFLEDREVNLLLPFGVVFEAGTHISRLRDGRLRRTYAEIFGAQVVAALEGRAPWEPMAFPERELVGAWLAEFPDHCMRELSFCDFSIVKEWQSACSKYRLFRVRIWARDGHLAGYDREV